MKTVVFDADNQIAGRLASVTARHLLRGEAVTIVNAEKAVISGNPVATLKLLHKKVTRGDPYHGPFYPREPDRILKRMVRGMISYHEPRGRTAFRRLRGFKGGPPETPQPVKCAESESRLHTFITLKDIATSLGK